MPDLEVPADADGTRLDTFLSRSLPTLSRRAAQSALERGDVTVNHRVGRKGMLLRVGDRVKVADTIVEPKRLAPNPDLPIDVVYEDSQIVVLDKPARIPSLALSADETDTVANFLLARFPETANVGKPLEPGIVHRLDTDTSGLLLVARTPEAHAALREQFARHRVRKEYLAVVSGYIAGSGEIRKPLTADRHDARRVKVASPGDETAQTAVTRYRAISSTKSFSVLVVEIETGARHQIRVHLASLGYPLVGDRLYGDKMRKDSRRQLLHACYLEIDQLGRRQRMEFRSAAPHDFRKWMSGTGTRRARGAGRTGANESGARRRN